MAWSATFEVFAIDGGFSFRILIGPVGDLKPLPWDGRSWNTRKDAERAARKSHWLS